MRLGCGFKGIAVICVFCLLAQSDWYELKEALQQSTLPILVDVHDWALLPKSFHSNIEDEYVVLQTGQ
ncbi:MAG: hypothetical protein KJ556_14810 [Gammaproteobacteria bacterium]|nr:hypothetical protein [Gammaproteobacteria bacterium]MBU2057688.1 hypothetical protein [Gammaproteobacteria bacterium]MBU2176389.1 hypothetical protein [Gammaproteobacteria bacterium]MBU2246685.1 hypothetical protein [Gammaproteobacteria bacterium]MBU2343559.1 hypothetical protein [Gammaproteobacteria bacterium]